MYKSSMLQDRWFNSNSNMGVVNYILGGWIIGPLYEMDPTLDSARVAKILRLDKSWALPESLLLDTY